LHDLDRIELYIDSGTPSPINNPSKPIRGRSMSNSVAISDVAHLVKTGNLTEAKRQARSLLADAEPHDLDVIARCAYVLQTWPKIGVVKLRAYWLNANQHDRTIIEACAPENGEQRHHTTPADDRSPRWTKRNKYQAPRDVRHEVRPELRRPVRPHPTNDAPAVVAAYQHERAGVDDAPPPNESPTAYALDYDRAAVPPLHGTPCVSCWVERAAHDQRTGRDDGLCTDCRDRGRPGITALPDNHKRADAIEARCAFIADRYPQAAIRVLRRYWQQSAAGRDRETIAAWVRDHHLTSTAAQLGPESALVECAPCSSCVEPRSVRDLRHVETDDGLCAQCRAVSSEPTAPDASTNTGTVDLSRRELVAVA
jgi:hypothetical protein